MVAKKLFAKIRFASAGRRTHTAQMSVLVALHAKIKRYCLWSGAVHIMACYAFVELFYDFSIMKTVVEICRIVIGS